MPALSPTMERGNIARWNIKEGASFKSGDVLAEVETDKATVDFESTEDGILAKILVAAGTKDVTVNSPVAVIIEDGADASAFANFSLADLGGAAAAAAAPAAAAAAPAPAKVAAAAAPKKAAKSWPPHLVTGMPALSPTMEKGNIGKWVKKVGDQIKDGDILAEIETDKATVDFEATENESGFVAKFLAEEGTQGVVVGQPVLIIVENKSDIAAFASFTALDIGGSGVAVEADEAPAAAAAAAPAAAQSSARGVIGAGIAITPKVPFSGVAGDVPALLFAKRQVASPRARAAAAAAGIDLSAVVGSGPDGRVTEADVKAFASSPRPAAAAPAAAAAAPKPAAAAPKPAAAAAPKSGFHDTPVTQIRKVIASRLTESKQTIPHYYLTMDCEVDRLMALRERLNKIGDGSYKLSVNDFIIKASAKALLKVPDVNSSWQGDFIRTFHSADINVAVATEKGLMTPLVTGAENRGLRGISEEVKSLAASANAGKLLPEKMMSGSFTISNLGMFGITSFSAVINPPQACILAVGGTQDRVIPDRKSETGFRVAKVMTVTLSCDHRVVDGAVGAQWLQEFKSLIQDPEKMLL